MRLFFSFVSLLFLSSLAHSSDGPIRTLIRIGHTGEAQKIFVIKKNGLIPSIPATQEVRKAFLDLSEGSEAIVEGRIHYEPGHLETQFRPYFIIEKIIPITLSDLGREARSFSFDLQRTEGWQAPVYGPSSIPVTTEVASAITLTTGLMLLEELTSSSGDIPGARDQQRALILSTGAFATLLFIYDQIQGKSKP